MPRIAGVELFELDLPFRQAFRHAAAERFCSSSLFVRCFTDRGHCGYGETLPRPYVTGEERGATFDLLAERILPRLVGMEFATFRDVCDFLVRCDGKAPPAWVAPGIAQTAAWCAVDLALLDTFGRAFDTAVHGALPEEMGAARAASWPEGLRFSLVLSGAPGWRTVTTLLKARLYGLRAAKVKVDGQALGAVRLARGLLGRRAHLRVDSNMSWSHGEARAAMTRLSRCGVESYEQPLAANDLAGMAGLRAETGRAVIADESFHDAASLERLIAARACSGVNVRIAKCGGLIAALARSRRALEAGLTLQIGCQVGETSQLSAAQLVLVRAVGQGVSTLEGCFGELLLETDPVRPLLQFGWGGRPPQAPQGAGFGTEVDLATLERHAGRRCSLGSCARPTAQALR